MSKLRHISAFLPHDKCADLDQMHFYIIYEDENSGECCICDDESRPFGGMSGAMEYISTKHPPDYVVQELPIMRDH